MFDRLIVLIFLSFFLQGCYQTSLAPMIGPAAGASQGRLAYSAVSTGVNYGVKHKTGKFPLEHVFKREKEKIVKKIDSIEKKVIEKKNNLKISEKANKKLHWVLHVKKFKQVKQEDAFPANKPRYSYWSKQK
jgi:hypothetical protein|tara:strand:- start:2031 stop:2426 length:396 start_codon:yes stop_codon:yes gene_type:complete